MRPHFPLVYDAIKATILFYADGVIKQFIDCLSGKELQPIGYQLCASYKERAFSSCEQMEEEIIQYLHTSDANTQVHLFENLKEWLDDWRICDVNKDLILKTIDEYNNKKYSEFVFNVEEKVKAFISTPNFQNRSHLEPYQDDSEVYFIGVHGKEIYAKIDRTNYKYYCINEKPEFIDTGFVEQYFLIVDEVINNFRKIILKYMKWHDEGKIKPYNQILLQQSAVPAILPLEESKNKIQVKLSVPQLAYLFKLLHEAKIFEGSNEDLYRFISKNFRTKGKQDEDISINSLRNLFGKDATDKDIANYWKAIFKEMAMKAGKV